MSTFMTSHLTGVKYRRQTIAARCPEHGQIGGEHPRDSHGWNAIRTEARAHDDMAHDVYRTESGWTLAVLR